MCSLLLSLLVCSPVLRMRRWIALSTQSSLDARVCVAVHVGSRLGAPPDAPLAVGCIEGCDTLAATLLLAYWRAMARMRFAGGVRDLFASKLCC